MGTMESKKTIPTPYGEIGLSESGEGNPLLMIHGLFTSGETFNELLESKPNGLRAIAPDLPDCGDSTANSAFKPTWDGYAHSVIGLADSLGLDRFDLLGHSMGGGISIKIAAAWPDRVRRLVLVDAISLPFPVPLKGRLPLVPILGELLFRMYGRKMFVDYFENDVFFDSSRMDRGKVCKFFDAFVNKRASALEALRATADPSPVGEIVSRVSCPTLILWGEKDALVPLEVGRQLEGLIPGGELHVIHDCGHSPLEERPIEASRIIWDFFDRSIEDPSVEQSHSPDTNKTDP